MSLFCLGSIIIYKINLYSTQLKYPYTPVVRAEVTWALKDKGCLGGGAQ